MVQLKCQDFDVNLLLLSVTISIDIIDHVIDLDHVTNLDRVETDHVIGLDLVTKIVRDKDQGRAIDPRAVTAM